MQAAKTPKDKKVDQLLHEFQLMLSSTTEAFEDNSFNASKQRHRQTSGSTEEFGRMYTPHYFFKPSAVFHGDIDAVMNITQKWIFPIHGPREHAKSTRARVSIIRKVLNGDIKYWLFGSETLSLAWAHIAYIWADLEFNERINSDYSITLIKKDESEGKLWLDIKVRATGKAHQVMLQALSYGRSGKGLLFFQHRPDGCILDDFENTRTARNSKISKEKLDWIIQDLYPAVRGPVIWFGNMGHESSALYHGFQRVWPNSKELKKFLKYGTAPGSFLAKMLETGNKMTDDMRLGEGNFYCMSFRADTVMPDGSTRYLWPENFNEDWYQATKATLGYLHEGENNGYPIRVGKLFKSKYAGTYSKLPEMNNWFTWLDPAFGKSRHSCYKVWVILASPDGRNFYVVDAYCRQGRPINEALDAWYKAFEEWETHGLRFGKYENNFGQDDRIEPVLNELQERRGYRLNVYGESNSGEKHARIMSMEPAWNLKSFHFPEKMNDDVAAVFNQFEQYPDGEYIDAPDAVESCYRRLRTMCGQSTKEQSQTSLGKRRYGFRRHKK